MSFSFMSQTGIFPSFFLARFLFVFFLFLHNDIFLYFLPLPSVIFHCSKRRNLRAVIVYLYYIIIWNQVYDAWIAPDKSLSTR